MSMFLHLELNHSKTFHVRYNENIFQRSTSTISRGLCVLLYSILREMRRDHHNP